jgi:hypothetical protein
MEDWRIQSSFRTTPTEEQIRIKEHSNSNHDLSSIKIIFLDQIDDPGAREDDFPNLKRLEGKWMANLGFLVSMDRVHGLNIRDDAKPKQQRKN